MDLRKIRSLIIAAVCSDDMLFHTLVLKGGNALSLIYGIGLRSSIDIDFSMKADFVNLEEAKRRLFAALRARFESHGFVVFDESLAPRPANGSSDPTWGGYRAEFKLIDRKRFDELGSNLDSIRRQSLAVGDTSGTRSFRVEISKFEYCEEKIEAEIEDCTIFVYTPPMIVAEKLRAICQQMEGYELIGHPHPRARDFYDIFAIVQARAIDLTTIENIELVRKMFDVKKVPLNNLAKISETREFHRTDWPSVKNATAEAVEDFDFYFDFVVKQVDKLKALWKE